MLLKFVCQESNMNSMSVVQCMNNVVNGDKIHAKLLTLAWSAFNLRSLSSLLSFSICKIQKHDIIHLRECFINEPIITVYYNNLIFLPSNHIEKLRHICALSINVSIFLY